MYVIDTNVASELMRPEPTLAVTEWIAARDAEELYLTAVSEAELLYGVAIMPFAHAALGRGRRLPAFRAQALRDSLGGAPVVALQVAGAPGFEVVAGHRNVLSAEGWNPGKDAPPAVGRRGVS